MVVIRCYTQIETGDGHDDVESYEVCVICNNREEGFAMAHDIIRMNTVFEDLYTTEEIDKKLVLFSAKNEGKTCYIDTSEVGFTTVLTFSDICRYPCKVYQSREEKINILFDM